MIRQERFSTSLIVWVTSFFWFVAKIISYKVWLTDRLFPLVPVSESFQTVPGWVHTTLFACSMLCLLLLIWQPDRPQLLTIVLVSEVLSCLLDQNRWQPWEYQFLLTFFIAVTNYRKPEHFFTLVAFLMAATYTYSGLHKLTPAFLTEVWVKMVLRGVFHLKYATTRNTWVYHAGYLAAITEVLIGLGLFFKPTRRTSVFLLLVMHVIILLWIGPLGLRYNVIVWPWNLLMITLLVLIFLVRQSAPFNLNYFSFKTNIIPVVLFGVMPAFCFFGLWDNYLSASLYSGKPPYLLACMDQPAKTNLHRYYYYDNHNYCKGDSILNVGRWALKELKVPPYPERRVLLSIEKQLNKKYPQARFTYFIIGL